MKTASKPKKKVRKFGCSGDYTLNFTENGVVSMDGLEFDKFPSIEELVKEVDKQLTIKGQYAKSIVITNVWEMK